MSKLNLVIADKDKAYVESFVDCLLSFYPQRFEVSSFTEEEYFRNYLEQAEVQAGADILLVGLDFAELLNRTECSGTVILLAEKITDLAACAKYAVHKYQCGDKLVSRILEIYSEDNPHAYFLSDGSKKTRVIAVYSPVGGAGKTTVAVGASIQSAWEGKAVFYLNLENMPSTSLFFSGEQAETFSNVVFYLKHGKQNRVEGAKCIDPHYKVHYYLPPDSALDLKEDLRRELPALLKQLRMTRQYDRIFIDMSCSVDHNNLAVLEESDEILVVCTQDMMSAIKVKAWLGELELQGRGGSLTEKVSFILNKYEHALSAEIESMNLLGQGIMLKIPRVPGLMVPWGGKYRLDMNTPFGVAVHQLTIRF